VALRQGKLEARFQVGGAASTPVAVVSATGYADDVFHNVVVVRTGKK